MTMKQFSPKVQARKDGKKKRIRKLVKNTRTSAFTSGVFLYELVL
jgi:hypothetical protein